MSTMMSVKRKHFSLTVFLGTLLSLSLLVNGCAVFGSGAPAVMPTSTENIVPPAKTFNSPSVPCDTAVQLIQQKRVSTVRFWYDKDGAFHGVSIVQPDATPVPGAAPAGLPGSDDIDVYSGSEYTYHYSPTAQCLAQVRAAIKQVNAILPASQQIKVERETVYGG